MGEQLNIIFFGFSPVSYGGGYETYLMKVARNLSSRGHKINIMTGDQKLNNIVSLFFFHKLFEKRISRKSISEKLPGIEMYEYGLSSMMPVSEPYKQIRDIMKNSDIIYTRNEIIDFLFIRHFCGSHHPPIVCGIHTSIRYPHAKSITSRLHNMLYRSSFYGRLLDRSSAIFTQNTFDTDMLSSEYKIEKPKIEKLLPFVDTDFFHPENTGVKDSRFKILFAGRLTEQKGIDVLCRSIERLAKLPEFNRMMFTVAGSGELEYMINNLAEKYDNVEFLGYVSDEKLVDLYNSHDVAVLPSRWETALKVVLEAQACGLPVIVSDVPGPNELIIPGKTGFLVKPEDSEDLCRKILDLSGMKEYNPVLFDDFRKNSVKYAGKYSIDKIITRMENLLVSLCSEGRSYGI